MVGAVGAERFPVTIADVRTEQVVQFAVPFLVRFIIRTSGLRRFVNNENVLQAVEYAVDRNERQIIEAIEIDLINVLKIIQNFLLLFLCGLFVFIHHRAISSDGSCGDIAHGPEKLRRKHPLQHHERHDDESHADDELVGKRALFQKTAKRSPPWCLLVVRVICL